jgi:hypothetical protein
VHAAVHVGVLFAVVPRDPVEDRLRLLGGGRVVQVDEGPAEDAGGENREVAADRRFVKRGPGDASG